MSTKIYNAYRVKPGYKIEDIIYDWQIRGRQNAESILSAFIIKLCGIVDKTSKKYKQELKRMKDYKYEDDLADEFARLKTIIAMVRQKYNEQLTSMERNPFNFDTSISFRFHKRRIYVQTYCDWTMKEALDFVNKDRRVEDFHFQNSTDKPNHISEKEWKQRERIWDKIYSNEGRLRSLGLDIVSKNELFFLLSDIERDVVDKIKKGKVTI